MSRSSLSTSSVTSSRSTTRGSEAAMCIARSFTSVWKSAVRATKSVSQFTSIRTPIRPPAWMYEPTAPSLVAFEERFTAVACPFWRRILWAFSRSPSASTRAVLQSIIGAPLLSRSSLTRVALMAIHSSSIRIARSPRDPRPAARARGSSHPGRPSAGRGSSGCACGLVGGGAAARNDGGALRRSFDLHGTALRFGGARGLDLGRRRLAPGTGDLATRRRAAAVAARRATRRSSGRLLAECRHAGHDHAPSARGRQGPFGFLLPLLLVDAAAVQDGVGDAGREQLDGAYRVVVARYRVVDVLRIAIGIHHSDDRDIELARLVDRDVLLLGVDHEEGVRQAIERLDAREDLRQLDALLLELKELLLGIAPLDRLLQEGLEPPQPLDALLDRPVVGERSAEPAHVHERHADAVRFLGDRLLGLSLGADEQDRPPLARLLQYELEGLAELDEGLLEIDDVDAVALAEDVLAHLRVPPLGLVPDVDTRLQELLHRHRRQIVPPVRVGGPRGAVVVPSASRTGSGRAPRAVRTSSSPSRASRA